MELSSDAIVTIESVMDTLNQDAGDPDLKESQIALFVNAASLSAVVAAGGRKFRQPALPIVERFDGNDQAEYRVRNGHIDDSFAPVISYTSDGVNWKTIAEPTYYIEYDYENGIVYITNPRTFHGGRRNWKIQYLYGWTLDTMPAQYRQAIIRVVHRMVRNASKFEGFTAKNFADSNVSLNLAREFYRAGTKTLAAPDMWDVFESAAVKVF